MTPDAQVKWIGAADGQPNVTGRVRTGTDAKTGQPIMSAGTPGYDVIVTPEQFAAHPEWAAYKVAPPLTRVWAGDEPTKPTMTVQLQFPDQATAEKAMASMVSAEAP